MRKILAILALAVALVLGGSAAAVAVPGSSLGTGQVTVENVWTYEAYTFPAFSNTTRDVDVDCPSGKNVIAGAGIWVDVNGRTATSVAGSALDSDTWRASFNYAGSPAFPSVLQVHATCI